MRYLAMAMIAVLGMLAPGCPNGEFDAEQASALIQTGLEIYQQIQEIKLEQMRLEAEIRELEAAGKEAELAARRAEMEELRAQAAQWLELYQDYREQQTGESVTEKRAEKELKKINDAVEKAEPDMQTGEKIDDARIEFDTLREINGFELQAVSTAPMPGFNPVPTSDCDKCGAEMVGRSIPCPDIQPGVSCMVLHFKFNCPNCDVG